MSLSKNIENYYSNNIIFLQNIFSKNESTIEGRICHPSIILLYILSNFIQIDNYMEIGVHNGGSMSMIISNPNNNTTNIIGIDLFEDMYDPSKHLNKSKFNTYQYFKRDNLSINKTRTNLNKLQNMYNNNSDISLIQGNSYFDSTEEKFLNVLQENKLDLLFIDGDHTEQGVKNDYERFEKYVKNGGYIIFDDYHHDIIKKYVDNLLDSNPNLKMIIKFKSKHSKAIDILIQKL